MELLLIRFIFVPIIKMELLKNTKNSNLRKPKIGMFLKVKYGKLIKKTL